MSDRQLADAAWAELTQTTDPYPTWVRKGKPAASHWTKAKALLDQIGIAPPPPPPPPAGWTVAPPVEPITRVTDFDGIGVLLVGGKQDIHDVIIDGCSNSGILLGSDCNGSTFKRIHGTRVASIPPDPGYGRHFAYIKGSNLLWEDLYCSMDPLAPNNGSFMTLRYPNQTVNRCQVDLCNWGFSFWDDTPDHPDGYATFTGGHMTCHNDWVMLCSAAFTWTITFNDWHWTCPNFAGLMTIYGGLKPPVLAYNQCSVNGKPVAASMISGPTAKLTIS